MTKEIWINLPVKDVQKSREFYTKIGFTPNENNPDPEQSASFIIGQKKVVLMLFAESVFKGFIQASVTDTATSSEVLISVDAESREEVDSLARIAVDAGGSVYAAPSDIQGWMYGCGLQDPDGHRWNVLFMDFSKMS